MVLETQMAVDAFYSEDMPCFTKADAGALQKNIAYCLQNLYKPEEAAPGIVEALRQVRVAFLRGCGLNEDEAQLLHLVGVSPTAHAFGLRFADIASPSKDDTRVAFIVGKPIAAVNAQGVWEVKLLRQYVLGMRVVGCARVSFTKMYEGDGRAIGHALITVPSRNTREEADRVTGGGTWCDTVTDTARHVAKMTRAEVDRVVADAVAAFDKLYQFLPTADVVPRQTPVLQPPPLRRTDAVSADVYESGLPVAVHRTDSEVVVEAARAAKRSVGGGGPFRAVEMARVTK